MGHNFEWISHRQFGKPISTSGVGGNIGDFPKEGVQNPKEMNFVRDDGWI